MSANEMRTDSAPPQATAWEAFAALDLKDAGNSHKAPRRRSAGVKTAQKPAGLVPPEIPAIKIPSHIAKGLGPRRTDQLKRIAERVLIGTSGADEPALESSEPHDPVYVAQTLFYEQDQQRIRAALPTDRAWLEALAARLGPACSTLDRSVARLEANLAHLRESVLEWELKSRSAAEKVKECGVAFRAAEALLSEGVQADDYVKRLRGQIEEIEQKLGGPPRTCWQSGRVDNRERARGGHSARRTRAASHARSGRRRPRTRRASARSRAVGR